MRHAISLKIAKDWSMNPVVSGYTDVRLMEVPCHRRGDAPGRMVVCAGHHNAE